jgi:hypothetical protein
MSDEARDSIIPLKGVGSRVMAVTVISKRTLARIIKEGKEVSLIFSTGEITSKKEGRSRRCIRCRRHQKINS